MIEGTLLCAPRGFLGERLEKAVRRLRSYPFSPMFVRSDVTFEMPRIYTAFSGDISGRFIEFSSIYGQMGHQVPELEPVLRRVLAAQREDGHFGEGSFDKNRLSEHETKIFWGNGRLLIGLMEYHRFSGDPGVLAAAVRLGNFLADCLDTLMAVREETGVKADRGAAGFATTFCSCIEGMVRLFEVTGNSRYAEAVRGMASLLPEEFEGFHSHGRLTALRGMADFAAVAGEREMLARVLRQWEEIASEHLVSLGGVREFFGGKCLRDEACSSGDWTMLSLKLFRVTGERKYLAAAEHCLLNHLLAGQFENGGFGHLALLPESVGKEEPLLAGVGLSAESPPTISKEAYWCCSFHGPRAILEVAREAVSGSLEKGLSIHLPVPLELEWPEMSLRIDADEEGSEMRVKCLGSQGRALSLRISRPWWAKEPRAEFRSTRGGAVEIVDEGETWKISGQWKDGDEILLGFNPSLELRPLPEIQPGMGMIFKGPLLLGYETSDDLLPGQMMNWRKTTTTLVFLEDRTRPGRAGEPTRMLVEYDEEGSGRRIWAMRVMVPVLARPKDQPLRTIHRVGLRKSSDLDQIQREELGWSGEKEP